MMSIVKVSQDELPKTIEVVFPEYSSGGTNISEGECSLWEDAEVTESTGSIWIISPKGQPQTIIATDNDKNGFNVSFTGSELNGTYEYHWAPKNGGYCYNTFPSMTFNVFLPPESDIGTYEVRLYVHKSAVNSTALLGTFQVSPPCPTSITLSVTPTL